jgi:arylsulfatase A-like enzyme
MNLCLSSTFGMVLFMIAQAGSAWASAVIKEGMPLTPPKAAPNVLILLTDDQGLSDLSFYGNPSLETPHLDALAHRSVRLENFLVAPTCSPTRAALLTGQHEFKVGITHTISGRSLLKPNIPTLAEHLKSAGYRTAIFGKWHLGETYPSRAQDRGFDEVFIHLGGGIGQTPDYWGNQYDNPTIEHNGSWEATEGYCTRVFTDAAWKWISANDEEPWFAYVAYNAPHTPLQIDDTLAQKYLDKGLPESQARFYAMIDDLDYEIGKLLTKLEAAGLAEDTIVIFMGDNGSAKGGQPHELEYNAGLRDTKGSAYQGGVRVPFFIRWPAGGISTGRSVAQLTSVMDLFPTLSELIGYPLGDATALDGRSIVPLLRGTAAPWPDRTIVSHVGRWANGRASEHKHLGSAIRNQRFSLVNGSELYDLVNDRGQTTNVADRFPEVFETLTAAYDSWWQQVLPIAEDVPPITVGAPQAPISHLTCMDWGRSGIGDDGGFYPPWNQEHVNTLAKGKLLERIAPIGAWKLHFAQSGTYRITVRTYPAEAAATTPALKDGKATLYLGEKPIKQSIHSGDRAIVFNVDIEQGTHLLEALIECDDGSIPAHGAFYATVQYLELQ